MSFTWASYNPPTSCRPVTAAGAKSLAAYLEDRFPYQRSMGIVNCRDVRGGQTLSHHGPGRAYDCGIPTDNGAYLPEFGDQIIELLGPHGKRLGLDHLILNRVIYSAKSPDGRPYKGVHPHFNHAHIGLTEVAGVNLNYATLVAVLGGPTGEDEVLPLEINTESEDVRLLQDLLNVTYGIQLRLDAEYGAETVDAVKTHLGRYTNHPKWKLGEGVGGRQFSRLLKDLAVKTTEEEDEEEPDDEV